MKSLAIIYTLVLVTGIGTVHILAQGLTLEPAPYGYELQDKPRTERLYLVYEQQGGNRTTLQATEPVQDAQNAPQGNFEDTDTLQPTRLAHDY